jgi:hypothetical protein
MAGRPTNVMRVVAAGSALPLLVSCSSTALPQTTQARSGTAPTQGQVARAAAIARKAIADEGASISNATFIERPGTVKDSNTGYRGAGRSWPRESPDGTV